MFKKKEPEYIVRIQIFFVGVQSSWNKIFKKGW